MNTVFGEYGSFVARHPCKVFWLAFIILIAFSAGLSQWDTFPDETLIWTPAGNPSLLARERSNEMFVSTGGLIAFMAEDKLSGSQGLLTK